MGLFANYPVEEVTVSDIASAADMTSAAVYYHFASKEQVLLEGMRHFSLQLLEETRTHSPAKGDPAGPRELVSHLLAWLKNHRVVAIVYFINSAGLNVQVETLRRETRIEMLAMFRKAVRSARPSLRSGEAAVIAIALVSLLETAAVSWLKEDVAYHGLGSRRFATEVRALADRIVGITD